MRFQLEFELETPDLPLNYRPIFISYIKNALTQCRDRKYLEQFFQETNEKDYCFSVQMHTPTFSNKGITLKENQLRVNYSTGNKLKTGYILQNAFLSQKNKRFPLPLGNGMVLKRIQQQKDVEIVNSKVIFRTCPGGGIAIREHSRETNRDRYVTFLDSDFVVHFKRVLMEQAGKAGFCQEELGGIDFRAVQCKKIVAFHYGVYIDVTVGLFEMSASKELLQHFMNVGIGSRKNAGFGMVNLVTQDLL